MKFDRKLTAALLTGCLSVGLAVPAAAAQELTATYGEAKYQSVAVGAYSRQLKVHNGKLVAQDTNGKLGLIDLNGNVLIPFQYDGLDYLAGDLYWIGSCPREQSYHYNEVTCGIVRDDGQVVVPLQKDWIWTDRNAICVGETWYDIQMNPLAAKPSGAGVPEPWTYYEKEGDNCVKVKDGEGRFNILDETGTPIFEFGAYDDGNVYTSQGARMFELYKDGERALANADGQIVVPFGVYSSFMNIGECSELVAYGENGQRATLDSQGNPVIPMGEYSSTYSENSQGYAAAIHYSYDSTTDESTMTSYLFRDGTLVETYPGMDVRSHENSPLMEFCTEVGIIDILYGLMTGDGQEVAPAVYDTITFGDTGIVTLQEEYYSLRNLDGAVILENVESIREVGDGRYLVLDGGKWGTYSVSDSGSGAYLIEPQFEELYSQNGQWILVKQNGLYQMLDMEGKAKTEPVAEMPRLFAVNPTDENTSLPVELVKVSWGPDYGDDLPFDIQPFLVESPAGSYTLHMNYKTGEVIGRLPGETAGINEDGWFAYQGENGLMGLGHVDIPANAGPSGWAADDVKTAIDAGLVPEQLKKGYPQPATRAEFCALAVQLYETVTGTEVTERKQFFDTTDGNVEKAAALGVVNGTGDGMFNPDATLTREQAATMLARLAAAVQKPLSGQDLTFSDAASVSDWAVDAVGQMQASGIMGGVGDNRFDPKGIYTREQSIITGLRLYQAVK